MLRNVLNKPNSVVVVVVVVVAEDLISLLQKLVG